MNSIICTINLIFLYYISVVISDGVFRFEKPADEYKVLDSLCPNNRTSCRQSETCCKTKHNGYHCCKYRNAVCCPDRFHCCPHGSTCDIDKKRCNKNIDFDENFEPMEWKIQKISEDSTKNDIEKKPGSPGIICSNQKTRCNESKTCCSTDNGNYYCCPHKNAICCSDKLSCCPEGTTCDLHNKLCRDSTNMKSDTLGLGIVRTSKLAPAYEKGVIDRLLSLIFKINEKCPHSDLVCQVDGKCCDNGNGNLGCCGYKDGVCCPNQSSCCPSNTACDNTTNTCVSTMVSHIAITEPALRTDICPDGKTECYSWQTCCPIGNNMFGCCPKFNATCCADKETCCPHNARCDLKNNQCIPTKTVVSNRYVHGRSSQEITRKSLVKYLSTVELLAVCPDKGWCRANDTCCLLNQSQYGCCGYSRGVCCADMGTCCPSDTKCSNGRCIDI